MRQRTSSSPDFTDSPICYQSGGITFLAAGHYYEGNNKPIAKLLKVGDERAIDYATSRMAPLLTRGIPWVLVPIPGHHGYTQENLKLCHSISMATGIPVRDVLRGKDRESNYSAKKNGHPLTEAQMGFRQVKNLPLGCIPVVIDNVIDTGVSAKAAVHALGKGIALSFAMTDVMMEQQQERIASKGFHR